MKKASWSSIFSFLFFTIFPIVSATLISVYLLKYQDFIANMQYLDWFLITLVFTVGSAFALFPPSLLAVIYGYFLAFKALPLLLLINFGAIFLVYFFSKYVDFKWIRDYLEHNKNAQTIVRKLKVQELKIIFFAKLSPVLPFAITNLLFAVSGARLKNVIIGGFAGMVPRTLLAIYTGSQAKEISRLLQNPNEGLYSKIFILILLIVSVVGVVITVKKALLSE